VKLGAPEGPGHFDDLVTALALAVKHAKRGRHFFIDSTPAPAEQEPAPPEQPVISEGRERSMRELEKVLGPLGQWGPRRRR
jgi:hypothetical protein